MSGDAAPNVSCADDVDALLESMARGMDVTPNNTFGEHPRFSMYKNYGKMADNQRNRRREFMTRQAEVRSARLDSKRTISAELHESNKGDVEDGFMEVDRRRRRQKSHSTSDDSHHNKPNYVEHKHGKKIYYRDEMKGRLMYSEWLIDVPDDMTSEWVMIGAPVGKRVLVLAENQYTYIYDKRGSQLSRFKSALNSKFQTTLVDGILSKNTIYVLDYLMTNDCDLEECEFDCRRVMGASFMRETGIFEQTSGQFKFVELQTVECKKESMSDFMSSETPFELDGLLFYYSKVFYTGGQTPLVGWLKPWMMPEILEVPIHPIYQNLARPTAQEFISDFARKHPTYGLPIGRKEHRRVSESQHDDNLDGSVLVG